MQGAHLPRQVKALQIDHLSVDMLSEGYVFCPSQGFNFSRNSIYLGVLFIYVKIEIHK